LHRAPAVAVASPRWSAFSARGRPSNATAWQHGVVSGRGVVHRIEPDGSHTFTIVVPAHIAEDDIPKPGAAPTSPWPERVGVARSGKEVTTDAAGAADITGLRP